MALTMDDIKLVKKLTAEQKAFYDENGYLSYGRVLSDEEVEALRQRTTDIIEGSLSHVLPKRFINLEPQFRENHDWSTPLKLDQVRKLTALYHYDDLFQSMVKKPEIVNVIEGLLGTSNIKLYTNQLLMKPPFHGSQIAWHQDAPTWAFLIPQDHVSCWVALDDATVENGCMNVIPGSHKWGPIAGEYHQKFLTMPDLPKPVPVEVPAGHCMFHHALNWHHTGPNKTPNRRRALAMHYMSSESRYLGAQREEDRLVIECEQPPGTFRFMPIRGREFPGRV